MLQLLSHNHFKARFGSYVIVYRVPAGAYELFWLQEVLTLGCGASSGLMLFYVLFTSRSKPFGRLTENKTFLSTEKLGS